MRHVGPDQGRLQTATRSANPQVPPTGHRRARFTSQREEVVTRVGAGRRKDRHRALEEGIDLVAGVADRRGRGHDFGTNLDPLDLPAAELVDRGLVEPDHAA